MNSGFKLAGFEEHPVVLCPSEPMLSSWQFLHMDLNNSSAEISALDFLFDRIVEGGIIVFDDFCWTNSKAQRQAEQAWFTARGLRALALPTGQALLRKAAAR